MPVLSYVLQENLQRKFLFCLPHRLEGFDGDLQHGPVRFARGQGLQSQVRLDEEPYDRRVQMIRCPADVFDSDARQDGNEQHAAE